LLPTRGRKARHIGLLGLCLLLIWAGKPLKDQRASFWQSELMWLTEAP
jgi:hypothetical protein